MDNYRGMREVAKTRRKVNTEILLLFCRAGNISPKALLSLLGNKKVFLKQFQKTFQFRNIFPARLNFGETFCFTVILPPKRKICFRNTFPGRTDELGKICHHSNFLFEVPIFFSVLEAPPCLSIDGVSWNKETEIAFSS